MQATDTNLYRTPISKSKTQNLGQKKKRMRKGGDEGKRTKLIVHKKVEISPHTRYGGSEHKSNNVNQQPFCCVVEPRLHREWGEGNRTGWKTSCGRCSATTTWPPFLLLMIYTRNCALVIKLIDSNWRTLTAATRTQASLKTITVFKLTSPSETTHKKRGTRPELPAPPLSRTSPILKHRCLLALHTTH
jgi:hypothetical protein